MSSTLPNGWAKVILDEVVEVRDFEREPINSSERSSRLEGKSNADLFPYYGATGQVGWIDDYRSEGEQVLLGEDGAPFLDQHRNKAYIVAGRYWVNNHAHVLRGIEGAMNNRFLAHQLNLIDYHEFVTGSTRLKLTSSAMRKIPLLLPHHAEQTRIVEKLEELLSDLDAGVAELKAAQRKLAQYRQSLLKAAVEGALTADWRAARSTSSRRKPGSRLSKDHPHQTRDPGLRRDDEGQETGAELLQRILSERRARWEQKQLAKFAEQGKTPPKGWQAKYPEPVAPDLTDVPSLPEGWAWASLDQLTEFVTSGSRGWADYYAEKGATFIRSQNINRDVLDLSDIAFVNPPTSSEGTRTRVQRSDLLLTITGANVGKTAAVDVELEEAYVSQHVALMRPVDSGLSQYLHFFLTCKAGGRGQLNKMAYGAGKPGLNLQQVQSVTVPVPNTHEMPRLLSVLDASLDAISTQADSIACALKQAAAQRKNILKAAFSGQLVPQDPNDEPASALLARIRAQREANADTPARKRSRKARGAA